jgi:hypothetical protein
LQPDFALHDGTNSVSTDQDVCIRSKTVRERKADPIAVFLKLDAPMTEIDRSFR